MKIQPTTSSQPPPHHRFTLIELLITITIIAILAATLLPALNKARMAGKAIVCASNERQFLLAYASYANDYNDYSVVSLPDCYATQMWSKNRDYRDRLSSNGIDTSPYWSKKGLLCPDALYATSKPYVLGNTQFYRIDWSYGMRYYTVSNVVTPFRTSQVAHPGMRVNLADVIYPFVLYDYANYPSYYGLTGETSTGPTAYRHPGHTANCGFFDGHIERCNWRDLYGNKEFLYNSYFLQ